MAGLGESVVVLPEGSRMKIHIHTTDPLQLRTQLGGLGEVVGWSDEPLAADAETSGPRPEAAGCLHIMTDAAGSLPRALARQHHITLLDSYIVHGETALPESLCEPGIIYGLMREGGKVTTAQAALAERHRLYQNICEQFGRTLYLAVGSAYTGNYDAAAAWKREHDPGDLLTVIDSGAASGRLALLALLVSRYCQGASSAEAVRNYTLRLAEACQEYVFIDTLRYLVAGGRVSRTSGLFGDLLHLKPVISPTREGVRKVGLVRNRQQQLDFALEKVEKEITNPRKAVLLLQYSDNEAWVTEVAKPPLQALLPGAEIVLVPLSLTSGVHMGPGTWSLAFAEAN
jgi:DegV family protein with EDD domain